MTDILIDENQVRRLIAESLREALAKPDYRSPIPDIVKSVMAEFHDDISATCRAALADITSDPEFAAILRKELKHKMARTLTAELSGSIDKAVNAFRQDPRIRADMVRAIERIIESEG